jgi:DNA-directed RNA polymerase subunit RPC12/RpoP
MVRIESELVCSRCNSRDFLEVKARLILPNPESGATWDGGSAFIAECPKCGYRMNVTPILGGRFWITEEMEAEDYVMLGKEEEKPRD